MLAKAVYNGTTLITAYFLMKKQKLVSDFNYEFELIGITSSVKEYKLAWAINKYLNITLNRKQDHEVMVNKKIYQFSYYLAKPMPELKLRLFSNRSLLMGDIPDVINLVSEFKHFDYILMREGDSQSFSLNSLTDSLKEVNVIEYLSVINSSKLKYKEHFVF